MPPETLLAPLPDLVDRRGDRLLLVWGGLAQWLVVDEELRSLLTLFDGRRDLPSVIAAHAQAWHKPAQQVAAELGPVVQELRRRRILSPRDAVPAPRARPEPRLANLTCNLTNACNLRCRFCYTRDHRSPEVPIELLMDRIAEGKELLAPEASFILLGGEPTLRPERLLTAIERAEAIFRQPVLVSTNGTLLTDELIERLAARRVEVQVSLDGPTAELHDAVRGEGVFAQATRAIERLARAGVPTIVSMVFLRSSPPLFEPMLDLAQRLGAREARFIPMRRIGAGLGCSADAPELLPALETLLEVLARRPELGRLLGRDYFSVQVALARFAGSRDGCGLGTDVGFIDADGTFYPCPNHCTPAMACGNLADSTLADLFLRSKVMTRLREVCRVENYPACRACPFRHWCAGECRGEAVAVSGDLTAPPPGCAGLQQVFRRILWLLTDGDQRLGATAQVHGRSASAQML